MAGCAFANPPYALALTILSPAGQSVLANAAQLGSVENQDSPLRLGVIQAFDG
jgi:hypothetical protein